jgi:hypothetical protein
MFVRWYQVLFGDIIKRDGYIFEYSKQHHTLPELTFRKEGEVEVIVEKKSRRREVDIYTKSEKQICARLFRR